MTREMRPHLSCPIALSLGFRVGGLLDFHGRDALAVAERIEDDGLQMGLVWGGRAAWR